MDEDKVQLEEKDSVGQDNVIEDMSDFVLDNDKTRVTAVGCSRCGANKLGVIDWLSDLPETAKETDLVEVQFKNTRKGYYLNDSHLPLAKGDMVAVEASPGHDIGEVTLTGRLVLRQMAKMGVDVNSYEAKKVYRKASENDMERYRAAKAREHSTMIEARQIAEDLHLDMKIGDVEYLGDGAKAIFYYIADERVDFRQLIKVFVERFHIKVEMKQIGARQEAGRIGAIGPCGRELCCASWMSTFASVSTGAAKIQDVSTNPQRLAGQCTKLKCCMNFEAEMYQEMLKEFPERHITLETKDATYYHFKTDLFKRSMTYSTDKRVAANLVTLPLERVKEIIELNKKGVKVDSLEGDSLDMEPVETNFENVVGQDSLTRFDNKKKKNKHHHSGNKQNTGDK